MAKRKLNPKTEVKKILTELKEEMEQSLVDIEPSTINKEIDKEVSKRKTKPLESDVKSNTKVKVKQSDEKPTSKSSSKTSQIAKSNEDKSNKAKGISFKSDYKTAEEKEKKDKEKLEKRKKKIPQTENTNPKEKRKREKIDNEYKERLQTDSNFQESFSLGKIIERKLEEMIADARSAPNTNKYHIQYLENLMNESKSALGEYEYFKVLEDFGGAVLDNAHTICWDSNQEEVLLAKDALEYILSAGSEMTTEEKKEQEIKFESIQEGGSDIPFL